MHDADLQGCVQRVLRGERRIDDLDRILLGLRQRSQGRDSIRELGDFVAHRDQREKGLVTGRARDILLSVRVWSGSMLGQVPNIDDILAVSAANLRTATDEQLKAGLGLGRNVIRSVLGQAQRKLGSGKGLTDRELQVVTYLGNTFIWNPAFTDAQVADDLLHVLGKAGLLPPGCQPVAETLFPFLPLYVVTLMHGSAILFEDGKRAELKAGFGNGEGRLEVKALLPVSDQPKPTQANVCLFWTALPGAGHCSGLLLAEPRHWDGPLDIDRDGKLAPAG